MPSSLRWVKSYPPETNYMKRYRLLEFWVYPFSFTWMRGVVRWKDERYCWGFWIHLRCDQLAWTWSTMLSSWFWRMSIYWSFFSWRVGQYQRILHKAGDTYTKDSLHLIVFEVDFSPLCAFLLHVIIFYTRIWKFNEIKPVSGKVAILEYNILHSIVSTVWHFSVHYE